ncbi:MAG: hypothetical protein HY929_07010 [Euryarchaeota archaeon]|nr:hypothetical protein [Euryarchaeota archaeon]
MAKVEVTCGLCPKFKDGFCSYKNAKVNPEQAVCPDYNRVIDLWLY